MADESLPPMRTDITNEIGTSGLRGARTGYIRDEFLPQLSGRAATKTYREMADNDPVCGAVLFAISMLIRQAKWTTQPADESEQAIKAAEFAESLLTDMASPLTSVMSEICTMFIFGYAPMEITWKKRQGMDSKDEMLRSWHDDGRFGIATMSLRSQASVMKWVTDEWGRWQGLVQQADGYQMVTIPKQRLALFRTQAVMDNPEGRSILRNAYRPWHMKKRIEEVEGIGLERDLAGYPVVRMPMRYMDPAADVNEKALFNAYKDLASKIRRDASEGVVLPSDQKEGKYLFDLQLLTSGGQRQFDTTKIVDRYDRRIATSVLADFIFLGQTAAGSFALSSDKTAMFATAVGGFLAAIADELNRSVLARTWAINGLPWDLMPTWHPGDLEKPDLALLGAFITAMAGAGAPLFPDRELENSLRSAAGLPMAPEDGPDVPEAPEDPTDQEPADDGADDTE